MNELKRAIGKTISSAEANFDGANSYVILKFKEGGKMNITGYVSGGEEDGVGQLDAQYHGVDFDIKKKGNELIGLKIRAIEEDYDGDVAFLRIKFDGGSELVLTSYSSDDTNVADISVDIYESFKAKFVNESLEDDPEWLSDGSGPKDDYDPKNEAIYLLRKEFNALVKKYKEEGTLTYDQIMDEIYNIVTQDEY